MIDRYTREELGEIWSEQRKLEAWLEVELAACQAWSEAGVVPAGDCEALRERARFDVDAVRERERTTHHDVAAFIDVVASSVGEAGRWFHYGLTSSDVLDTGLALQIKAAGDVVLGGAKELVAAFKSRAIEFKDTICVGRTHGVHAEPISFGLRLAGFALEAERNRKRLERAFGQAAVGKLSGAVGTYASTGPRIEHRVMELLGLTAEPVSTQIVPRDRHAELVGALALAGAGLERFATEIRHLQRTEVREVEEPFGPGQKGSSAMPHKRNPIISERIAGLARLLRGYTQAALENVVLWHERDISHSSVERVILPDSTILIDYMQQLAIGMVGGMIVHEDRMRANLDLTSGALFSQRALTALVEAGLERDKAYGIVQSSAQKAWNEGLSFRNLLAEAAGSDRLSSGQLDEIFDLDQFLRHVPEIMERLEEL